MKSIDANLIEEGYLELEKERVTGEEIIARKLPLEGAFIAVNASNDYLFIVRDNSGVSSPSRRLKLISVDYLLKLKAKLDGDLIVDTFTVVTLPGRNGGMLPNFCILLSFLLQANSYVSTQSGLRAIVESIIELFTPRLGSARDRAKGLFGELSVIAEAEDTALLISSWHDSLNANKDFSLPDLYIEVKSSEGSSRKHDISTSQLRTDNSERPIYVASVLLEEDPNGLSVIDFFQRLRHTDMPLELQLKLTHQVLETVGLEYAEFSELRFSLKGGVSAIQFVSANDIPIPLVPVEVPTSAAVSAVRFVIDFDILESKGVTHYKLSEILQKTN